MLPSPLPAAKCLQHVAVPRASMAGRGCFALPVRPVRVAKVSKAAARRTTCMALTPDSVHAVVDSVNALVATPIYTLADAATEAVAEAPANTGFLAPIVGVLEAVLKVLDSGLESANVPYSYGFSIILLTILVKILTFPLSKQQVESTMAMQALQPQIKSLQKQYAYDKERLQMETARLYQENNVNPLAGCLPTLATLPVWIGLYRALSNVANEGLLEDGFFWIPSLAGPSALASGGKEGGGMSWLLPLTDGAPPVGWHDAGAYLVLPVLLVASQYVSQAIISPPKTDDSSAEQANAILKFLPLMIGWFSLNVPSGLTLYWFTNNLLTTGQQVYLRKSTAAPAAAGAAGVAPSAAVLDAEVISTGGDSASAAAVEGESRKERRERERAEKRGARFAERKAKEALSKEE